MVNFPQTTDEKAPQMSVHAPNVRVATDGGAGPGGSGADRSGALVRTQVFGHTERPSSPEPASAFG